MRFHLSDSTFTGDMRDIVSYHAEWASCFLSRKVLIQMLQFLVVNLARSRKHRGYKLRNSAYCPCDAVVVGYAQSCVPPQSLTVHCALSSQGR